MKDTAIRAARVAGNILLDNLGRIDISTIDRKKRFDFVTQIDKECERAIIELIRERFPEHDILAEESGSSAAKASYRWIIDPLDGTTNYIHGYPAFSVSIAVECQGKIVLGVVYDPIKDELFSAEANKGAYLNDKKIRVSLWKDFSLCLLATGFPFRNKEYLDLYWQAFSQLFLKASGVRRAGSAALDLAYVACGRIDGFWELGLSPWDIAAGDILIREAGGQLSDFEGGDNHIWTGNVVATNALIHNEIMAVVQSVFKGKI